MLAAHGLSLRKARDILEKLANQRPAVAALLDAERAIVELAAFGVIGAVLRVADVDVKQMREEQHLPQPDFASWYGLEVDTVRNWEQGRYEPDGPAKVLLNVIEREPDAVIRALLPDFFKDHPGAPGRSLANWLSSQGRQSGDSALLNTCGDVPMRPPPEGYVWVLRRKESHTE